LVGIIGKVWLKGRRTWEEEEVLDFRILIRLQVPTWWSIEV